VNIRLPFGRTQDNNTWFRSPAPHCAFRFPSLFSMYSKPYAAAMGRTLVRADRDVFSAKASFRAPRRH